MTLLQTQDQSGLPQSARALRGVRDLLLSGEIGPGERLAELALVERLGLSRTPVRAALAHLAQEGLLEALPTGGYSARRFSQADVVDTIELRGTIEGLALRLAAERGADPALMREAEATLDEIDAALDRAPGAAGVDTYARLNSRFHVQLAALSGSEAVRRELERVMALPFAQPSALLDAQAKLPRFDLTLINGQMQHHAMLEAVRMREGARAEALAREHARLASRNVSTVVADAGLARHVPALTLVRADAAETVE